MKIVNFKKTAAGIMSVAMMLSATVLPGTVENLPAISNVLTASADDTDPNAVTPVEIVCDKEGLYKAKLYDYGEGKGTKIVVDNAASVFYNLIENIIQYKESLHDTLEGALNTPVTVEIRRDTDKVIVNDHSLTNLGTVDSVVIGKGAQLLTNSFGNTKIKNLTIEATTIPFAYDCFNTTNLSTLESFTFVGTKDEYEAFKSVNASVISKITNANPAKWNVPGSGIGDDTSDLPAGVTVDMNLKFGKTVGGAFVVTSKNKYVRFTISSDDSSIGSGHQNINFTRIIKPNDDDTIDFYISPKNMATKLRYTVEVSEDGDIYTGFTEKYVSVEQYLNMVLGMWDAPEAADYQNFIKASLIYGYTAQKYFNKVGQRITGPKFEYPIPAYSHSAYGRDYDDSVLGADVTFDNWGRNIYFDENSVKDYIGISMLLESETKFRVHNKTSNNTNSYFESGLIPATYLNFDFEGTAKSTGEKFTYNPMMWINKALDKDDINNITYQMGYALKQFAWEAYILKLKGRAQ